MDPDGEFHPYCFSQAEGEGAELVQGGPCHLCVLSRVRGRLLGKAEDAAMLKEES